MSRSASLGARRRVPRRCEVICCKLGVAENRRLKQLVVDLSLDPTMIQDVLRRK